MASPSAPTIKRLFNSSGQTCNDSDCSEPVIDDLGKVNVDVAHIAGNNPTASRYDDHMTDEERHGFDNLILLCPTHHRRIDRHPEQYSIEDLHEMKKATAAHANHAVSDADMAQIVVEMSGPVSSHGQTGGQTAGVIVNQTPQSVGRSISANDATRMTQELSSIGRTLTIGVSNFAGNSEAASFKASLLGWLTTAGANANDAGSFTFFGSTTGLAIAIPFSQDDSAPWLQALWRALLHTGQPVTGNKGDPANGYDAVIQVWPDGR